MINSAGKWAWQALGAGNITIGHEWFETVVPDSADEKYPGTCSQSHLFEKDWKNVEEQRLLKKKTHKTDV